MNINLRGKIHKWWDKATGCARGNDVQLNRGTKGRWNCVCRSYFPPAKCATHKKFAINPTLGWCIHPSMHACSCRIILPRQDGKKNKFISFAMDLASLLIVFLSSVNVFLLFLSSSSLLLLYFILMFLFVTRKFNLLLWQFYKNSTCQGSSTRQYYNVPSFWEEFLVVWSKYSAWLLREFPDKSSNFGLLYGRVYGPLPTVIRKEVCCTNTKT